MVEIIGKCIELLQTHEIIFPLKNREQLLEIKNGKVDFETIGNMLDQKFKDLEKAMEESTLPEQPNWEKKDEIILEMYRLN